MFFREGSEFTGQGARGLYVSASKKNRPPCRRPKKSDAPAVNSEPSVNHIFKIQCENILNMPCNLIMITIHSISVRLISVLQFKFYTKGKSQYLHVGAGDNHFPVVKIKCPTPCRRPKNPVTPAGGQNNYVASKMEFHKTL